MEDLFLRSSFIFVKKEQRKSQKCQVPAQCKSGPVHHVQWAGQSASADSLTRKPKGPFAVSWPGYGMKWKMIFHIPW